jgi:hypothetical protein
MMSRTPRRLGAALAGQRLAVAAVALYPAVALLLALPPTSRWALLVLPGVGLLVSGIRSNRAGLIGGALVLAGGGWSMRLALGSDPVGGGIGGGRALVALGLGLGLLAVSELARLAVDAGPRRGPVRVEEALRRRTLRQDAAVGALGLLVGSLVVALAGIGAGWPVGSADGRGGGAPSVFLPLGVLAVAAVAALVVVIGRRAAGAGPAGRHPRPGPGRVPARDHGRDVRRVGPRRWTQMVAGPRRWTQLVAGLVLVGAVALPTLAALGAGAPLPAAPATDGGGPLGGSPGAAEPDGGPAGTEPPATEDPTDTTPQAPPWALLGALAVLGGLALLFLRGERLVSADDLRPDVAPPDDLLVGAPSAPDVRALPPEEVAAILEDALGYLRADLEPRLAVRCAYAAVAGGLGRFDLGRRPAETELEFLGRQLGALADVSDGGQPIATQRRALTRLTDLFEVARFSDQVIDDAMRAEALDAVEALLARGGVPVAPPGVPR